MNESLSPLQGNFELLRFLELPEGANMMRCIPLDRTRCSELGIDLNDIQDRILFLSHEILYLSVIISNIKSKDTIIGILVYCSNHGCAILVRSEEYFLRYSHRSNPEGISGSAVRNDYPTRETFGRIQDLFTLLDGAKIS